MLEFFSNIHIHFTRKFTLYYSIKIIKIEIQVLIIPKYIKTTKQIFKNQPKYQVISTTNNKTHRKPYQKIYNQHSGTISSISEISFESLRIVSSDKETFLAKSLIDMSIFLYEIQKYTSAEAMLCGLERFILEDLFFIFSYI